MALVFPETLTSSLPTYFRMAIYEYPEQSVSKDNNITYVPATDLIDTIYLPVPSSGNTENIQPRWEITKGSLIQGDAESLAKNALKSAADSVGATNVITGITGKTIDPKTMPVFQTVEHRQFQFSWLLMPRTKADSATLANIINTIKTAVLPRVSTIEVAGVETDALKFPHVFKLEYVSNGNDDYLPKFHPHGYVCVNIDVALNEGATWYQFESGEPVSVTLTMTFVERSRLALEQGSRYGNFYTG